MNKSKEKKGKNYYEIKHKQEVVSEYKYKNSAHIRVYAVYPPMNGEDSLLLHLQPATKNKEKESSIVENKPVAFYMRPDEALLIIRLLADAVNRTTKTYEFGLQDKKTKDTNY